MKFFSKTELSALAVIFLVLVAVSVPNFIISLRRSRDQVRRDDLGTLQRALDDYHSDFGEYPISSQSAMLACKKPEDSVSVDKKGRLIVNLIPCRWGQDALVDLTPGSTKIYDKVLPGDPNLDKGRSYAYFSDGSIYQIFASFEGKDEAEYDQKLVNRNIMCGTSVCNVGRSMGCSIYKSIEECEAELLKGK